ncbi:MAG: ATP-dependent helicase DinG [Pseudomonadota bacterium]|jgi:ATP-dependent DNA helicase DinG
MPHPTDTDHDAAHSPAADTAADTDPAPDTPMDGPEADPPSGPLAREALALAAFDHLVSRASGFRPRPGQRDMAAHIAQTLSGAVLSDDSISGDAAWPARGIAVVQAGTGVGKSAAYAATVIALALAQQKRVLFSTATVALQEQLMHKDLPALAALWPEPFSFSLAKGRGRYICRLKLDQLSSGEASSAALFDGDEPPTPDAAPHERWQQRARQYQQWSQQLDSGQWQGDRDRLDDPPEGDTWAAVAAERHSCTGRHCPSYHGCSYFQARARLAQSQVIVVNHDLLLSTLGKHALPELQDCYVVFDEAHHLGTVAQGQFTASMDVVHTQWLDRLPRTVDEVASALQHHPEADTASLARQMKASQNELARLGMDRLREQPDWQALISRPSARQSPAAASASEAHAADRVTVRFADGVLPAEWLETVSRLHAQASALLKVLEALAGQLKASARDNPGDAPRCALLYSRLGTLAPRLQSAQQTMGLWLQDSTESGNASTGSRQPPLAKWLEASLSRGVVQLSAHACPLEPGSLLRQQLWGRVRAAVVTSASLTSCGSFDHFLRESGLVFDAAVRTCEAQSPFDHARQGRLVVVQTEADPKDVEAYTREMLDTLLQDLAAVQRGALVLFTSKLLLRRAQERLERGEHSALRQQVLVQGQVSRQQLLRQHAQRVGSGQRSILFGLQSFGEGLDLPGELCEWVFITKLPFASPSDPVGQARADWLKAQGRDPFTELVVPATGARLLQWTGRAIRSETDEAVVVCYDDRLLRQSYGRRLLKGLPAYRLQRRYNGVLSDISPS